MATKICPICDKPHKQKTQCCAKCNRELKNIVDILYPNANEKTKPKKASIGRIIEIKQQYNINENVFDFIRENKDKVVKVKYNKKGWIQKKKEFNINDYLKNEYKKWNSKIPAYILELFNSRTDITLLTISGNKTNPLIYYKCNTCNKDFCTSYNDFITSKAHKCITNKSSGECIVEKYLTVNDIEYKTQYDTLKCINPITNHVMPYDIEISDKKVIIEIQGRQHYEYIPYFHGTLEGFKYQQLKDRIKKDYAESKGYKVVYLSYHELENNTYKQILQKALK